MKISKKHNNWEKFITKRKNLNEDFLNPLYENLVGVADNFKDINSYKKRCEFFYLNRGNDKQVIKFLKKLKSNNLFGKLTYNFNNDVQLSLGEFINGITLYQLNKEVFLKDLNFNNISSIKILEIGPGYGEFANLFIQLYKSKKIKYDLIDLNENLIYSKKYLSKLYNNDPKVKINYFSTESILKTSDHYDLIVNTYSFQEMLIEVIDEYFELIFKKMSAHSFFFSVNTSFKWDIKNYSSYGYKNYFKNISSKSLYTIHNNFYSHNEQLSIFKKLSHNHPPDNEKLMNRLGKIQELSLDQLILKNSNITSCFSSDINSLIASLSENEKKVFDYFETNFIKNKLPVFRIKKSILNILLNEINNNSFPDKLYFEILLIQKNDQILGYFNEKYNINLNIDLSVIKRVKRYLKRVLRLSR
ncbi:MAG: hypothetical protein CMD29_05485 [Flavobacteriales bacterium]|nr:hypothetical protein [Flavobacteriales bacterium]